MSAEAQVAPPLPLPVLLAPAVRERIAQARELRATLALTDHTGMPLAVIGVVVAPPFDGALGCVLRELWHAMQAAEGDDGLAVGRAEWARMTASTDFPELPKRKTTGGAS